MLRLLHDCVLVRLNPLPEKVGAIVLVGSGQERVRTGTVLRTGPGKYQRRKGKETAERTPMSVHEGDRVAFFRENLEHKQGKQLVQALAQLDDDTGLLRESDILYVEAP